MVAYKQRFRDDPVFGTADQPLLTSIWSDHLIGRPETSFLGVSFTRGGYSRISKRVPRGSGGYTVHRPEHWVFEGTELEWGDLLGARSTVVGYECDGCAFGLVDGLPTPTGEDGCPANFTILATSPVSPFDRRTAARPVPDDELSEIEFNAERLFDDSSGAATARLEHAYAVFGTWTTDAGGVVVNTGCTDWVCGLDAGDPDVERVTHNVLRRLRSTGPEPIQPP